MAKLIPWLLMWAAFTACVFLLGMRVTWNSDVPQNVREACKELVQPSYQGYCIARWKETGELPH